MIPRHAFFSYFLYQQQACFHAVLVIPWHAFFSYFLYQPQFCWHRLFEQLPRLFMSSFSDFTIKNFSFNYILTSKNLSLNDFLKYQRPGRHFYSLCPGRHLCPGIPVCNFSLSVAVVIYIPSVLVCNFYCSVFLSNFFLVFYLFSFFSFLFLLYFSASPGNTYRRTSIFLTKIW